MSYRARQRTAGVILLILCAVLIAIAGKGVTLKERDITGAVFIAPLGIWLIVTKQQVMYDIHKCEGGYYCGPNQAHSGAVVPVVGGGGRRAAGDRGEAARADGN